MKVLGVSFGYHDSSVSLISDGIILSAIAEERLTQQKHDENFPYFAIESILNDHDLTIEDIDKVIFHEDPYTKFSRVLTSSMKEFPNSRKEFVNSIRVWLSKKLWALNEISNHLSISEEKIAYLNHHFSHATAAFMSSGLKESSVLVIDAVGDWSSTALYSGQWSNGKPIIKTLKEVAFPNSLGLLYSSFTAFLGFLPNDGECSTMALAAFGRPIYKDKINKIVQNTKDGYYSVDQSYFNFTNFYKGPFRTKFYKEFGLERNHNTPLRFSCFENADISKKEQYYADIAASIQSVLEDTVLHICKTLYELNPSKNLCLAGGVALNCVLNQKIIDTGPFENIFIPIDPGDGGTSLGTSLYYSYQKNEVLTFSAPHLPYLGSSKDESDVIEMLPQFAPQSIRHYTFPDVHISKTENWNTTHFKTTSELNLIAAQLLAEGKIIGRFSGRAEFGPRALGNRSILARPDNINVAKRLSTKVKHRALYRPYAFSILDKYSYEYLDINPKHINSYRWMQVSAKVKTQNISQVLATVHVDKTTRPQVVIEEENPDYFNLISFFAEQTGIYALLNTSFNPSGLPLVNTPMEALTMFARSDMDALILNNNLIIKER